MHLLSVVTDNREYPEFKLIRKVCCSVRIVKINKIRALLGCLLFFYLPFEVAYCFSSGAKKEILKFAQSKNFDVVYLKRLRGAVFLPNLDVPVVIDTTDAMSMFYERMSKSSFLIKKFLYKLEAIKYRIYERRMMKKYKSWIVCSPVDQQYLAKMDASVAVHVVPNPVDTEYFKMNTKKVTEKSLLFRGLMDKPVNMDAANYFVNQIMPIVRRKIKDIKLFIVGPKPVTCVKKLDDGKNVFVLGYTEDLREWMSRSYLSVCPVRIATGTRFKILQSWAAGRPVVSTTIGASGLEYTLGEDIEIADSPREFAKRILELLDDKKHYEKLARNGRLLVLGKYSFLTVSKSINDILFDLGRSGFPRPDSDDVFSSASSPSTEVRGIRGFKNKVLTDVKG